MNTEQLTTLERKIERFSNILEQKPGDGLTVLALAEASFRRGLKLEALTAYQEVTNEKPVPEAHLAVAEIYSQQNMVNEAYGELIRLFEIDPDNVEARLLAHILTEEAEPPDQISEILAEPTSDEAFDEARLRLQIQLTIHNRDLQERTRNVTLEPGVVIHEYYVEEAKKKLIEVQEMLRKMLDLRKHNEELRTAPRPEPISAQPDAEEAPAGELVMEGTPTEAEVSPVEAVPTGDQQAYSAPEIPLTAAEEAAPAQVLGVPSPEATSVELQAPAVALQVEEQPAPDAVQSVAEDAQPLPVAGSAPTEHPVAFESPVEPTPSFEPEVPEPASHLEPVAPAEPALSLEPAATLEPPAPTEPVASFEPHAPAVPVAPLEPSPVETAASFEPAPPEPAAPPEPVFAAEPASTIAPIEVDVAPIPEPSPLSVEEPVADVQSGLQFEEPVADVQSGLQFEEPPQIELQTESADAPQHQAVFEPAPVSRSEDIQGEPLMAAQESVQPVADAYPEPSPILEPALPESSLEPELPEEPVAEQPPIEFSSAEEHLTLQSPTLEPDLPEEAPMAVAAPEPNYAPEITPEPPKQEGYTMPIDIGVDSVVSPDLPEEPVMPEDPVMPQPVAEPVQPEPVALQPIAEPVEPEPVVQEASVPVVEPVAPELPPEPAPIEDVAPVAPESSGAVAAERQAYYESKAEELGKLTGTLARTRGVTSIFLVSRDGTTIDSVVKDDVTEERIGELVKESFEFLLAYAKNPAYWVLECTGGIFVMQALDDRHVLIAVGQAGANFGALRYTMDKTKAKFATILDNVPR